MKEKVYLKKEEEINLKKLFNLENKIIERIIVTIQDEGLVKITLTAEEEIQKTIDKEYAFIINNSLESVECFLTALEDSSVSISIKLKEEK